ncbi:ketopantoate reductase family protein [Paenibacillus apiarius]|uniref:2-dehydropantoate 2-reductase n=1 Tax=Paenibacillus apiarius TaxID=46240 RepID=A0ABT4DL94_9BACL|nr:2-dehydropantoate 2-reductase [Paenibacillus apiarius]MCY9513573.1 2-dehydropantoate 2-reductase [Paenibacillus apiarius]MCY9518124.1 2-dehydropantoate 2-reductase [Paenibacillus apiarius]MCY9551475.1 2-dehydropantoate 2-reductase [Paenibacillus apiarius]MCY9558629.1 2-dehydropantoate 2-reductase [Paenibacillus apiarius]MCY9684057.1 2-dehydropantoate 2-reductase [Paenibacillus apiarius]
MHIDIIGAGSLGMLYAARLQAGRSKRSMGDERLVGVRLWTRTAEQARVIQANGIRYTDHQGQTLHVSGVEAYPLEEASSILHEAEEKVRLIWLFVKQTHIQPMLLDSLRKLPRAADAALICFQNGVGHVEALSGAWPAEAMGLAVTTEAARRQSWYEVVHTGMGSTWIGPAMPSNNKKHLPLDFLSLPTKNLLENAGFQAFVSNNIEEMIYQKLLVNAVVNPLTALLRVKNGQLLATGERISLMKDLFHEVVAVYRAAQLKVDVEADWERVVTICRNTANNTSSMLQDILEGRQTECDAITGAIIKLGAAHQVDTPAHAMVYRLIQAIEIDS